MKRDCSVLPSIESIKNIESKRIYVAVFLLVTIILVSACADAARETNNPDIGSPNPPTFKTTAGNDTSGPVEIIENTQVSTDVTLLAEDPDGNLINWKISTAPVKGTAVISAGSSPGTSKTIRYIPQVGATGADSFVVTIDDGTGFTSSMTVNVTIAFTVSVTVSGYTTGNTMVLQINGKNDLLVSADGTFTFSDTLDSGDRYEVTNSPFSSILKTSCLFNNASGEIISSNITNVAVICADDIAPNIVSITPDAGTTDVALDSSISVVFDEDLLANSIGTNAVLLSDTLGSVAGTINYNVSNRTLSIVPTEPLALLRPYTVTLSPEITDIAGQAIVSNPWTFTTRDGVWGGVRTIEVDKKIIANSPKIAMNSNGQGIMVWQQGADNGALGDSVWASHFDPDTKTWGTAILLSENGSAVSAYNPTVVINSFGEGIVVWWQPASGNTILKTVWAKYFYPERNTWDKAAIQLSESNNPDQGDASFPQVALDSRGQGIAVWRQTDSNGKNSIRINRFDPETKAWEKQAKQVSAVDNPGSISNHRITMNSDGNAIVVWQQFANRTTQPYSIYANRFDSSANIWSGVEQLSEIDSPVSGTSPSIAMNADGKGIAVWQQPDNRIEPTSSIWAKHFNPGTKTWGAIEKLSAIDNLNSASFPLIAIDSMGQALAVWRQKDSDGLIYIWANNFNSGSTTWNGVTKLSVTDNQGSAGFPDIALNSMGQGLVVWDQAYSGGSYSIWSNRFNSITKNWGKAKLIESDTQQVVFTPQIVQDATGYGIAVWNQSQGLGFRENRFE